MANLIDASASLIDRVDRIAAAPRGPPSEARYQSALKTLLWFSGQHHQVKKGICPEAINNLEPQCDKWISRYEHFIQTHRLDNDQNRRALFDRLTGAALEYLRK